MDNETTLYRIQGSRVFGQGMSINCTNIVTAEQLCNRLNTYEKTVELNKNIEEQFDKITKQIIQVNMTLQILNEEVKRLTGDLNGVKPNNRP